MKLTDAIQVKTGDEKDLREFIRNNPPGPFKPLPFKNVRGNMIEWYFSNKPAYAETVQVDGVVVGHVLRDMETNEVVGVKICLEAVK